MKCPQCQTVMTASAAGEMCPKCGYAKGLKPVTPSAPETMPQQSADVLNADAPAPAFRADIVTDSWLSRTQRKANYLVLGGVVLVGFVTGFLYMVSGIDGGPHGGFDDLLTYGIAYIALPCLAIVWVLARIIIYQIDRHRHR